MSKVTPRTPSGFNEYLPGEQIEFNRILDIIRTTYEKYGYAPIDTPDIELSEVLLAKGGGETEQQIYRFTRGHNDLSLRFDLTVPLARYVAEHEHDLVFPFRRYHIGRVHRAERAQAGRFREFYQCDIDVIGSDNQTVDAEVVAVANEIFEKLDFGDFTIHLSNRLILNGLFESICLGDLSKDAFRIIDKAEKISHAELLDELKEIGLSDEQINQVVEFISISGTNDEILTKLETLPFESSELKDGVNKLATVIKTLRIMGVPEDNIQIDLRIVRGLDYYTGTVYETILNDHPGLGSICSGGRYDNLANNYTDTKLPGVGISIGLTRLFYELCAAGIIKSEQQTPANVVIIPISEAQEDATFKLASVLRASNIATVVYSEAVAMKKKMRYADNIGCQYLIVIGEDEVANNTVSLKNMRTGENEKITTDQAVAKLARETSKTC